MPPSKKNPIGIIDIGSNSVRFVVYEPPYIGEYPVFNEKVQCGLGRDLNRTGRLNKAGMACTIEALAGFQAIAKAMKVKAIHAIGTAALRDAKDGVAFADIIRTETGFKLRVISGEEEAKLAATGILGLFPRARGVVGDLGGGSLELAHISGGKKSEKVSAPVSLPLGTLRIMNRKSRGAYIEKHLSALPRALLGHKTFYAVGGTWRALGHIHRMNENKIPHTENFYRVDARAMAGFAAMIARQTKAALIKDYHVDHKRAELLPAAALLMAHVLARLQPEEVVITRTSLRDGFLHALVRGENSL